MKTIRIPLMVATALAAFAVTTAANAQYKPTGDDGITAPPKSARCSVSAKLPPLP